MSYFPNFSILYSTTCIELYVLGYLDFIFGFLSIFSTAQNGPLCQDT